MHVEILVLSLILTLHIRVSLTLSLILILTVILSLGNLCLTQTCYTFCEGPSMTGSILRVLHVVGSRGHIFEWDGPEWKDDQLEESYYMYCEDLCCAG